MGASKARKLSVGIVGCGAIAEWIIQMAAGVPELEFRGCMDVDLRRAQAFAQKHGIGQVYADYRSMLAAAEIEALYLAVPHDLHFAMLLDAIQAGKPTLLEKPLTSTLDDGVALVERIRQSRVKVGVNYQFRYERACYALARAMQRGDLGRVFSVRVNVPWQRGQSYFDNAPWHRTIARAGGGTLITQASHFLDAVLWGLGEAPVSAMGYTATPGFDVEVETLAHGVIETSGGALISVCSTMAAASDQGSTIEVYGDRCTAKYRERPRLAVKFLEASVRRARQPIPGAHALQRSLAGFARWVLYDEPYLIPAESSLPVLAAVDGVYRSACSGQRVTI